MEPSGIIRTHPGRWYPTPGFETLVCCHIHASTAFNGVRREIYYD